MPGMSGLPLKDQPVSERPRERLVNSGADSLSQAELLAILLRTGVKGASAVDLGKQLLEKFHSLESLAKGSLEDLRAVKGIGRDKAVTLLAAFTLARKMAEEKRNESPLLDTPDAIATLMREDSRLREVETFQIILLNTRRRLIRVAQISEGTLDLCWFTHAKFSSRPSSPMPPRSSWRTIIPAATQRLPKPILK